MRAACGHGLKGRLGGQHAGLDGGVAALDAAHVQEAGIATHQRATGEHGLGQDSRPPAVMARAP